MQIAKISDGNSTLLFSADLFPMSSHVPLPFIMGYDLFPIVTLEEKRKYLAEANKKDTQIFFEHDPFVNTAKIGMNENGFYIKEKLEL